MIEITDRFKAAFPDACAGVLVMRNVSNPSECAELDARKEALEAQLRERFAGADRSTIRELEPIKAYNAYYRKFRKTYHVQLQLESVALKGRSLPRVAALVESMFMAEIKNLLLTAGHDLDVLSGPVKLDVSGGTERYTMLSGKDEELKAGDMFFADAAGVMSSIIYGPDARTRISSDTKNVVFTIYGTPGITPDAVKIHLQDIRDNVLVVAPDAEVELLDVIGAS